MGQPGFFDLDKRLETISAKGDPLEVLNFIVPFENFRADIEAVVRPWPRRGRATPAASLSMR